MRKLHLQFKNADGSRKTIIIKLCHQNLSPESVRQAMEDLIALKLFERNGIQLYTEIVGAKYVETRVTKIFDRFTPKDTSPADLQKSTSKKLSLKEEPQIASTSEKRKEYQETIEMAKLLRIEYKQELNLFLSEKQQQSYQIFLIRRLLWLYLAKNCRDRAFISFSMVRIQ
ncbi:DUF2922 domain-containing protein [Enterococcus sp. HY326]|uniref:DUF2922 domain-containing protein n=1 Tax=Enterococcus sp. HY326 TaxID=2971265 RepID=UPI00223EDD4A|nr:DUF2922 domain-containing protein [Enterococcus sp. HY326]